MDMKILVTSCAGFDRPVRLEIFGLCLELSGITEDSALAVSAGVDGVTVSLTGSQDTQEAQQPVTSIQQTADTEPVCSEDTAHTAASTLKQAEGSETLDVSKTAAGIETADVSEVADVSETVADSEERQKQLFQELSALRKKIASGAGLPPYVIFHDSTLKEMCRLLPSDLEALKDVSGVGKAKLEKYGAMFTEVIKAHITAGS
jgi:superfamily II DNA helicase RecQ